MGEADRNREGWFMPFMTFLDRGKNRKLSSSEEQIKKACDRLLCASSS
jgi:hypothetical protein